MDLADLVGSIDTVQTTTYETLCSRTSPTCSTAIRLPYLPPTPPASPRTSPPSSHGTLKGGLEIASLSQKRSASHIELKLPPAKVCRPPTPVPGDAQSINDLKSPKYSFWDLQDCRLLVYKYIFTPTSSSDQHTTIHDTCLTMTWITEDQLNWNFRLLKRYEPKAKAHNHPFHFSCPTNFFKVLMLCNTQIKNEILPVVADNTSLHLSGAPLNHFKSVLDAQIQTHHANDMIKFRHGLLRQLFHELVQHTPHLIIDQPVLRKDLTLLPTPLTRQDLFSRLRRLTVHHAGLSELSCNWRQTALAVFDAKILTCTKRWPNKWIQWACTDGLDRTSPFSCAHRLDPEGEKCFVTLLHELRDKLLIAKETKHKLTSVEIVWKLPLKEWMYPPPLLYPETDDIGYLDTCEISIELGTLRINDVTLFRNGLNPKKFRSFWSMGTCNDL
ncbi:hypothetical protein H2198_002269 [Neophaeococcomyces mojaviensis]|uniref:Uncharacterized protein n=1 Tax=Neophaeococcomyces mojaviensis TaxID=3383035 RepID=A0ACC3AEY3_9EURO|nr:hypothetical protein H2198_002269 [Knufia sp. JES_112]